MAVAKHTERELLRDWYLSEIEAVRSIAARKVESPDTLFHTSKLSIDKSQLPALMRALEERVVPGIEENGAEQEPDKVASVTFALY